MIPRNAITPCRTGEYDPDLWFSEDPDEVELARILCAECPFRVECATLGTGAEYGVWGGEKHVITKAQRMAQRIAEVMELHDRGLKQIEIARSLDLAHSSVAVALKRGTALRQEVAA